MQRCSGLLNRRARGSTVATHHFGGGTRIEKFMRSLACPARRIKLLPSASSSVSIQRSRSSMYRAPRFERGGCRRESCRECQFTGMWLNPNSRGSRLRIWQPWGCNSLHAHHFTATGFSGNSRPRRLKIAEPSGCKSRVADRRVVNREQQTGSTQDRTALGVQVSPRRPIWNVNRTSEPGLGANECVPPGKWCKSTAKGLW